MGTTLDRSPMDTAQSWIATLHILRASLPRSRRRLTVVLASPQKTTPSSSSPEMLLSSCSPPASQCVSNLSPSSLPLEGLLSVTRGRPSLWASSRPPPLRLPRASRPRLPRRHSRRNEMLSRGNLHMGIKLRNSKSILHNPGSRNFGDFLISGGFPRLAFISIERNFVGYVPNIFSCPIALWTSVVLYNSTNSCIGSNTCRKPGLVYFYII